MSIISTEERGNDQFSRSLYLSYLILLTILIICSQCSIYTQEVLVMLILLCDAPWKKRATLLFMVFRCIGTEEISHEDFILAAQVVAVSLCRLWGAAMWNAKSLTTLSESIADNAFTKVLMKYYLLLNLPHHPFSLICSFIFVSFIYLLSDLTTVLSLSSSYSWKKTSMSR